MAQDVRAKESNVKGILSACRKLYYRFTAKSLQLRPPPPIIAESRN